MRMNCHLRTEKEEHTNALCKQRFIFKPISLDGPKSADTIKNLREYKILYITFVQNLCITDDNGTLRSDIASVGTYVANTERTGVTN
jgi:hypothetical protein